MPSLKSNVLYNGIFKISYLIFPLITFPYVARILGPNELGRVNFIQSFVQIFVLVTSLGLPNYGIREIAKFRDNVTERSKLLVECLFIKTACTVIGLIIYLFIILYVTRFQIDNSFYLLGLCTIFLSIFDINYLFSALEDFKYISIRSLFVQLVSLIFVFVVVKSKEDALKYYLIPIITIFITSLINVWHALPVINFKLIKINTLSLKKHIKPILYLSGIVVFSSLGSTFDKVLLGFFTNNTTAVGYFSPCEKISSIALAITMVLAPVMMPRISYLSENGKPTEINDLISKSLNFTHLLGVPLMFGIYTIAPELIIIFAGNEYLPSITVLRILSIVPFIAGFTTLFTMQIFMPFRKDKALLWCMVSETILCLGFNAIFTPSMQQNGAAISRVLTEIITMLICYFTISFFLKLNFPIKNIVINIIFTLPFLLFGYLTRLLFDGVLLRFLIILIACVIYYCMVHIYLLKTPLIRNIYDELTKNIFKYGD